MVNLFNAMFGISRQRLYSLSRNREFLLKTCIAIVATSVACAVLIWIFFGRNTGENRFERIALNARSNPEALAETIRHAEEILALRDHRSNPNWRFDGLFGGGGSESREERAKKFRVPAREWIGKLIQSSEHPPEQRELFQAYADALLGKDEDAGLDRLAELAAESPEAPFVNELHADLLAKQGDDIEAIAGFHAELAIRPSEYAANQLILHIGSDPEALRQLLEEPEILESASAIHVLGARIVLEDIGGIFKSVLALSWQRYEPVHLGLGLFVAAVWFVIIGQLGGFRIGQLAIYLLAVLLGIFSAVLTLFAVIVQENVFETLTESRELIPGLIYFIAGVGLREEALKLICFLPLVPILLRRRNEMEALVVASMVGLGFALEENLGYYQRYADAGDVAVGRFLTANFLHMAMTGLIGFACFRMFRFPKTYWEEFLATFLIVVTAHGFYNAVLSLPAFAGMSLFSIIILAMLAYRFFAVSGTLSMTGSHQISPLGIFTIGTACIVGVSLNVVCFGQAPHPGYVLFALEVVPLLPVVILFVNQWRSA